MLNIPDHFVSGGQPNTGKAQADKELFALWEAARKVDASRKKMGEQGLSQARLVWDK